MGSTAMRALGTTGSSGHGRVMCSSHYKSGAPTRRRLKFNRYVSTRSELWGLDRGGYLRGHSGDMLCPAYSSGMTAIRHREISNVKTDTAGSDAYDQVVISPARIALRRTRGAARQEGRRGSARDGGLMSRPQRRHRKRTRTLQATRAIPATSVYRTRELELSHRATCATRASKARLRMVRSVAG